MPVDVRPRVLSVAIDFDDTSASLELALDVAPYFELEPEQARAIAAEVAGAVSGWRDVAAGLGLTKTACDRMASAFEHADLEAARALTATA